MVTPAETEAWIGKEEAAKLLGVSTRQVERLAKRGLIRKRYMKAGEGRRYGCTQFQRAAVVSIDREREQGLIKASDATPGVAVVPVGQSQAQAWSALAGHLAKLSAAYPAPRREWPAFLSVDDAAEYWNVTAADITTLVEQGLLHVPFGRGRKTWRIQRASLDAYGQAAHQ